ncbi:MAG: hypothetical protein K2K70_10420 [Lachnospiraceae bacterium]|nr:hypothetical protein [Lachnospiraceae bacterium]
MSAEYTAHSLAIQESHQFCEIQGSILKPKKFFVFSLPLTCSLSTPYLFLMTDGVAFTPFRIRPINVLAASSDTANSVKLSRGFLLRSPVDTPMFFGRPMCKEV